MRFLTSSQMQHPGRIARSAGARRIFPCAMLIIPAVVAGMAAVAAPASGSADDTVPELHVELNKLDDMEGRCRAYILLRNRTGQAFASLKLDLVMFDEAGIVAKRLAVQAAPLPVSKTALKVFDIKGLPCARISQILANDILECRGAKLPRTDCMDSITTSSRTATRFIK